MRHQKVSQKEEDKLNNINSKNVRKQEIILGTYKDVPEYMKDNEYIRKGYLLNCNSLLKAIKSLFYLHNESVNVWSHLIGAIFFFCLVWYTAIFITNYKTQLSNVKKDINQIEQTTKDIKNNNTFFLSFINSFNFFKFNIYNSSFNKLNDAYEKMNTHIDNITSSLSEIIESLSSKFERLKEKVLDLMELEHIAFEKDEDSFLRLRQSKKLRRWPLFIFLVSAILCLSFSATFHLVGGVSKTYHEILSRFDYGGISLLITGSCYPPYYYFFYCEDKIRIFYLSFMTIFGLTTFFLGLTNNFNLPKMRSFRGRLYLLFGICAGLPIIHMTISKNKLKGYTEDTRFLFWYIGGIIYIIGGILYIIRFPERKFPGKVDFFGSSHQLFHFLVVIAAVCHYIGCLDSYYMRFDNMCE